MRVNIEIPQLGESVNEATISQLLRENGAVVQMDEEIVELETDKVNQVLSAPRAGQLHLDVQVDDTVTIGQVIGYVETEAAAPAEPPPAAPPPVEKPPEKPPPPEAPVGEVRRKEKAFVEGIKPKPVEAPKAAAEPPVERSETRSRMSKIRRVIADRLVEAQHTTAMLTTFNEVDLGAVMALRKKYKELFLEKHGVKLGFMSWFVKACVAALKDIPDLNSYIDGTEIVHRNYIDIGIAVGTERGLMVPVVRDCDKLSLAGIEAQIVDYAKQARAGTISVDALRGGGFTITNGGVYGSLLSTPILNPPQSGILGMHKIQERPMSVNGEVQLRPMMYLALSYDHRIVDGQGAVTFLVRLKEVLEDPARLVLEL